MKRYTFDVKLFATVYVLANSEDQARMRIHDFAGFDELGAVSPHMIVGCASTDGEADLVDEEEVTE